MWTCAEALVSLQVRGPVLNAHSLFDLRGHFFPSFSSRWAQGFWCIRNRQVYEDLRERNGYTAAPAYEGSLAEANMPVT
eukprot:1143520-Pelagomonas_calceolata.AAC.6